MGVIENYKASLAGYLCNLTTRDPYAWGSLCYSYMIHADFTLCFTRLEDAKPLLLGLFNLLLYLGLR